MTMTDTDTADAVAIGYITKNPGIHGEEVPPEVRERLASLESRGLLTYSRRSGWNSTRSA